MEVTTMRLPTFLRLLPIVAVTLALLAPARPGHGQDTPPPAILVHGGGEWILAPPTSAAPVLSSTAQVTGTNQVYLPLLMVLPGVGIQFGSGLDAQKNLISPGNTFDYGIAELYYRYTVIGALDQPYLAEWSFNGVRQPQLDDSGTILSDSAVFTNSICTLDLSQCSVPVPRGTYHVKFFIDDVLYGEASAIVQ
jgi:hypothetical protein